MDDDNLKTFGIGCLVVILLLKLGSWIWDKASSFISQARANYDNRVAQRQAENEAAEQKRQAEDRRIKDEAARKAEEMAIEAARIKREERLKIFAMKEAPILWKVHQDLQGAIVEQDKRIADLAKTLETFNKDPMQDADYLRIRSMRDEMVAARDSMHTKIEDAYLAFCKFQATPSRKDYGELRKKTLEDGIKAAEDAARRFDEMRSIK